MSSSEGTSISKIGNWATLSSDPTNPQVSFGFPNIISGGNPGERIAQLGITALSNGSHTLGNVQGIATCSGGETQTASSFIPLGVETHDTFFGYIASSGQWITRFDLSASNLGFTIGRMRFEDLGFVTTGFIPEPSSCLMGLIGTAGVRCFIRRRSLTRLSS